MGTTTSKSVVNDNIVVKNYKDDKKPYKYISGYSKIDKSKDTEMIVNNLGDRKDQACNSLSYY